MKRYKQFIPLAVLLLFFLLLLVPSNPASSFAGNSNDTLTLDPNTQQASLNDQISVQVNLHTENSTVNAAGVTVHFDPSILQIVSVDTTSSFCTFYADRSYNDATGTIKLFCGKPNPGFSGDNTLETIVFQTIAYGKAEVSIDPTSLVLKNDGKGTNILKTFEKKSISVILSN